MGAEKRGQYSCREVAFNSQKSNAKAPKVLSRQRIVFGILYRAVISVYADRGHKVLLVGYYLSSKHEGSSYRTEVLCKARGLVHSALDDISFLK